MKKRARFDVVLAACLTFTLVGCLGPPALRDGQRSGLTVTGARFRNQLMPYPASGILPSYRPASCDYDQRKRGSLGSVEHTRVTLSVETVTPPPGVSGVRLFAHLSGLRGPSTVLMDSTGKLVDFDVVARDSSHKLTSEGFDPYAEEQVKKYHAPFATNTHFLNDTTAILPHFIRAPSRPGVAVANVLMERDEVWAVYVYRGVLTYHGTRAELFDLIHMQNTGPRVRGFLLFDTQHMLPLVLNLSLGFSSFELEQIGCQGP